MMKYAGVMLTSAGFFYEAKLPRGFSVGGYNKLAMICLKPSHPEFISGPWHSDATQPKVAAYAAKTGG
ncbi:MAG: hypothetical protein WKF66_08775 [Pedobacter sp.]